MDALFDRTFDILVVGGGVVGACAVWDAALRGMRVALIDRSDFASGTSSNSLKVLHGGLRFLKRGLPAEAREAVRERRSWMTIAPHLVKPLPVLVPTFRLSIQNKLTVGTLLRLNDTLARDRNRGLPPELCLPGTHFMTRTEALDLVPALADTGLSGAAVFHDAQIHNTERLVLEIVRAAVEAGAVVANHVEFEEAVLENGKVVGARLRDRVTGHQELLRVSAVINAAGAQSTEVDRRLLVVGDAPDYPRAAAINVMLRGRGLRTAVALQFHPRGAPAPRQIMWAPWRDREIIGTHHMIVQSVDPLAWRDSDATQFLADLGRTLPALDVRPEDVVLVHAGLLPLDRAAGGDPTGLLRRHRIFDRAAHGVRGVISAVSVRFTTARATAELAVDMAARHCGRAAGPCRTAVTPLPSAPASPADLLARALADAPATGLPHDVIEHLVRTYGSRYHAFLDEFRSSPGWNERVEPGSPVIAAELLNGVRNEMALSVTDLLYRRVELGSRGAVDERVVAWASAILSAELGRDAPPFEPQRPPWPWDAAVARGDA